jgi:hypothetical protein
MGLASAESALALSIASLKLPAPESASVVTDIGCAHEIAGPIANDINKIAENKNNFLNRPRLLIILFSPFV